MKGQIRFADLISINFAFGKIAPVILHSQFSIDFGFSGYGLEGYFNFVISAEPPGVMVTR